MVAPKRGRGAKAQAAKAKAATTNEQIPASDSEVQNFEAEDNGVSEEQENNDQAAGGETETTKEPNEKTDGEQNKGAEGEAEAKTEKPEEPKIESGKLLVENLPPTYLFDYQEKLKELFSKYGEVSSVKRGPIIVTELTTSPTLSAIVEFKNKEFVEKALAEEGTVLDGCAISVAAESRPETAVLVGVPYEASTDYVRLLFAQCGEVAHIHEFSKTKYKILRVTFHDKEAVDKALKLDRELRINGFMVTVSKYRDEEEQKAHNANINKNKRQHPQQQNRPSNQNSNSNNTPNRNNARARQPAFNARPNFRGGRGGRGGFAGRGGFPPRGGFVPPVTPYMPPQPYGMGRPGGFMDGQRPNKRMRQM